MPGDASGLSKEALDTTTGRAEAKLVFEGVRFSGRYLFDDDVMLDYALDVG